MRLTVLRFIIPANTASRVRLVAGTLSPVRAEVSNEAELESSMPSSPSFSPGFSCMISPILASLAGMVTGLLSRRMVTSSGRWSTSACMLPSALVSAML